MASIDKVIKAAEELMKKGRGTGVFQGKSSLPAKVTPGGGVYQGKTPLPSNVELPGIRGEMQGNVYQGRGPFSAEPMAGGPISQSSNPLVPLAARMGGYGPAKMNRRMASGGGASVDDIRNALLGIDPSLAGGVRGAGPRVLPSGRSLMRIPQPPVPPQLLGPGAAAAGGATLGLAAPLRGDTPPQAGPLSQPVSTAPTFNAAGMPSKIDGPVTRPVPNGPVQNTVGIPPNINSPRADPPKPPLPPEAAALVQEMASKTPMPRPRPQIPMPKPRPRSAPAPSQEQADNRSILEMLFGGTGADRFGRKYEPPYPGY